MNLKTQLWAVYAAATVASTICFADGPIWATNPNAATVVGNPATCGSSPVEDIACSAVTDNFCSELWNKANKGTLVRSEDKLQLMDRDTFVLQATKSHFEAVLKAKSTFPQDLLTKAKPYLEQMAAFVGTKVDVSHMSKDEKIKLATDQDGKASKILSGLLGAIDDVGYERLVKVSGSAEGAQKAFMKSPEKAQSFIFDLGDEVIHKVYDRDPNWLRVTHLVEKIRERSVDQISHSELSAQVKQRLISKLRSVQAVLPSANPRKFHSLDGCGTTTINANYDPISNKLTICAGLFNTYQSENLLYMVLAHEFNHSIDPRTVAVEDFQNSRLGRIFDKIQKNDWSHGPVSCDNWNKIKTDILDSSEKVSFSPGPLFDVSNCLVNRSGLPDATSDLLDRAAQDSATNGAKFWRDNKQIFSGLSDPNDKLRYLRPDRLKATFPGSDNFDMIGEFYAQEVACNSDGKASPEAEEQALLLMKSYYRARLAFTLREEGDAGKYGVPSFENYADMMATKLIPDQLRKKDLTGRRQALGFITAAFCDTPTGFNADGSPIFPPEPPKGNGLSDAHDTHNHRRHSFFSKDVATMLHCQTDDLTRNASVDRCKL